jgi:hypothetical protein
MQRDSAAALLSSCICVYPIRVNDGSSCIREVKPTEWPRDRTWSSLVSDWVYTCQKRHTTPWSDAEGDDHAVIKDSPERYARIIGSGGQVKPKSAFLSSVLRLRNHFGNDKSCGNESRIHSGIRPSPYSSISHLFDSIAKPQWSRFLLGQGGCSNSRFLLATWPKKGSDQLVQARPFPSGYGNAISGVRVRSR